MRALLVLLAACGTDAATPVAHLDPAVTHYSILSQPMLGADGVTSNIVRVIATSPDGTPARVDVVLGTNRPGAGRFASAHLALGEAGGQTAFIACTKTSTGCLGPVTLLVALASAPATVVAQVDATIVDPLLVDPAKDCRGGGNALHATGDDQIFTGTETIDATATWDLVSFSDALTISATTATSSWRLLFNITRVVGGQFYPGIFLDATLASEPGTTGLQPVGYPAMSITHGGVACSAITGRFQILDYQQGDPPATTILFEQHCEGSTTTVLRGCVHVQP